MDNYDFPKNPSEIITIMIQKMATALRAFDELEERRGIMLIMECGSISVALFQFFGTDKIDDFGNLINYICATAEAIARPTETEVIA